MLKKLYDKQDTGKPIKKLLRQNTTVTLASILFLSSGAEFGAYRQEADSAVHSQIHDSIARGGGKAVQVTDLDENLMARESISETTDRIKASIERTNDRLQGLIEDEKNEVLATVEDSYQNLLEQIQSETKRLKKRVDRETQELFFKIDHDFFSEKQAGKIEKVLNTTDRKPPKSINKIVKEAKEVVSNTFNRIELNPRYQQLPNPKKRQQNPNKRESQQNKRSESDTNKSSKNNQE